MGVQIRAWKRAQRQAQQTYLLRWRRSLPACYYLGQCGSIRHRLIPIEPPLAFPGGNGVNGPFFIAAIAVIVAVLVGVSTRRPWLWGLFSNYWPSYFRPQSSSASRLTAGAAGFFTLIQSVHLRGPGR
jgi:hypothetical protein